MAVENIRRAMNPSYCNNNQLDLANEEQLLDMTISKVRSGLEAFESGTRKLNSLPAATPDAVAEYRP
jgi:hypothetical protein